MPILVLFLFGCDSDRREIINEHDNGNTAIALYSSDSDTTKVIEYYENGQKSKVTLYESGTQHRIYEWWPDSKIKSLNYVGGDTQGENKFWQEGWEYANDSRKSKGFSLKRIGNIMILLGFPLGLLGWLYPHKLRGQLDELWIRLDDSSFYKIGHDYIANLLARIEALMSKKRFWLGFVIFTFSLNSLALFVGMYLKEYLVGLSWSEAWDILRLNLIYESPLTGFISHTAAGILGVLLDLLSLKVTLFFLRRARDCIRLRTMLAHIFWDLLFGLFLIVSFMVVIPPVYKLMMDILQNPITMKEAWNFVYVTRYDYTMTFVLSVSAGLATFLYMLSGSLILLFRITPRPIQKLVKDVIFKITTDNTPVFKTLAVFTGGVGALISAVLNLI